MPFVSKLVKNRIFNFTMWDINTGGDIIYTGGGIIYTDIIYIGGDIIYTAYYYSRPTTLYRAYCSRDCSLFDVI